MKIIFSEQGHNFITNKMKLCINDLTHINLLRGLKRVSKTTFINIILRDFIQQSVIKTYKYVSRIYKKCRVK
jgi:predicted AAA+ superfamily ATPase